MTTEFIKDYLRNSLRQRSIRRMMSFELDWDIVLRPCLDTLNRFEEDDAEYELRNPEYADFDAIETAF